MDRLLENLGISQKLAKDVVKFREFYKVQDNIQKPKIMYHGIQVLEQSIAAILQQNNLLLWGNKSSGKNILADTLCYIFGRNQYNLAFHNYLEASEIIGTDTFIDNKVQFRDGTITKAAREGGFAVLDEINMAKNDAMSVLFSVLDYRRRIDVPGYESIQIHEASRFIATMNYGYLGTKELNEALLSRFVAIKMESMSKDILKQVIKESYTTINEEYLNEFTDLFFDLQEKAKNFQITSKSIDVRGLISAIGLIKRGIAPVDAFMMGLANKVFDDFERDIVSDAIRLRIPKQVDLSKVFGD